MKYRKYLVAVPLALTLAGCETTSGVNPSLYSVNQPVVSRTNYVMDLNVSTAGVSAGEKSRIAQWFEALNLGYGDRIAVDFGNGYPSAAARQDVADLAAVHGMLLTSNAPVTQGNVQPGTVRIVVTRSKAEVPNCPNWRKTTDANYSASTHPNYGCAVNSNMAAMVADPEDLVRGQEAEADDTGSGNNAINSYRTKRSGGNP